MLTRAQLQYGTGKLAAWKLNKDLKCAKDKYMSDVFLSMCRAAKRIYSNVKLQIDCTCKQLSSKGTRPSDYCVFEF